jgi:hypothetical protein
MNNKRKMKKKKHLSMIRKATAVTGCRKIW